MKVPRLFRTKFLFVLWLSPLLANAQKAQIVADVYAWDKVSVKKAANSQQRVLLEGATPAFTHLKVHATTVAAGKSAHAGHAHSDEELIIVKEGQLTLTMGGKIHMLEKGSIALILPHVEHALANDGQEAVTYYIMRYEAAQPQPDRQTKYGGSFVKHWNDMEYKTHDKGGRRNVFDTATPHSERFEMHITTLNEGLMSHPPHTHKAAEILLLIEGQAEESINGKWISAGVGDIIFLQSQVPHAIRNTGKGAATYFAFQFE